MSGEMTAFSPSAQPQMTGDSGGVVGGGEGGVGLPLGPGAAEDLGEDPGGGDDAAVVPVGPFEDGVMPGIAVATEALGCGAGATSGCAVQAMTARLRTTIRPRSLTIAGRGLDQTRIPRQ